MITTDASMLGWGAVVNGTSCGGQWTTEESESHINVLELKAMEFGVKSFFKSSRNEHIRIRSDNMTAIQYINNKGGVKSIPCHKVARSIWEWAISKNNLLSAEHIPGSQNILADKASRVFDVNTEWSLDKSVYDRIERHFFKFDIDLFASRLNAKHPRYASWKPDPNASFVDSFLSSWAELNFYAFPPFSMLMRTVTKIENESARGVLVCPVWATQPWFPQVMRMLVEPPLILPPEILSLPFKQDTRHAQKKLRLMACHLSGNPFVTKDFQTNPSQSCARLGEKAHRNSTLCTSENGYNFVLKGMQIPFFWMKF